MFQNLSGNSPATAGSEVRTDLNLVIMFVYVCLVLIMV